MLTHGHSLIEFIFTKGASSLRGKDESRKVRQEGGYWKSPVRNEGALVQVVANPLVITGKKWVNIEQ